MTDSATQLVITDTFSTLVTDFNTVSSDLGATGDLNTGIKTNVVASINELEADLFNVEGGDKRTLASLTTTDKTCVVDAINELDGELGVLSTLTTDEKGTIVGAINEIEGVFDASAKGISAGTYAFDITTTHASGISLDAPVVALTGDLTLVDGEKIKLGTDADLQIYHDGSHSYIDEVGTGSLRLRSAGSIVIEGINGDNAILANGTTGVTLYHANDIKLETQSGGVDVTGTLNLSSHLDMPDAAQIKLGNDDDFILEHVAGGSISKILGQSIRIRNLADTETMASFNADGSTNLFYNGLSRLGTTATGIAILNGGLSDAGKLELGVGALITSGGTDAMTFSNANVTMAGNATVSGTLSVGSLTTTNQTVKLAIDELHGEVTTNATNIGNNTTAITNNDSDISANATNIGNNTTAIGNNDSDISANATNISANATNIGNNTTAITANTNARTANATAIGNNDSDISANATNISSNATNITANTTARNTNATAIGNLNNLDSDISVDRTNLVAVINELQEDIRQIDSDNTGNTNLVGTLAQLTTSAKNNCVVAINELDSDIGVNKTKLDGIEAGANVTDTANVVAALIAGTNITIANNGTISAIDTQRAIHSSPSENANNTSISSGWAFANVKTAVPLNAVFTDNNTEYSTADSDTLGLVKIGYSENGQNYPVELDNDKMFVTVPWNSDTNTQNTYNVSAQTTSGGAQLRLGGSGHDGTTIDNVKFASGGATTVSQTDTSTITITSTNTNQLTTFQLEDGDGTEVTISHGKEVKFTEGQGINVNWTDTSTGSNADPYDMQFALKTNGVRANELNVSGLGTTTQFLRSDGDGSFTWAVPVDTNTTYTVGDGGLTQKNFTTALKSKLDGIESNLNAFVEPSQALTTTATTVATAINELKAAIPLVFNASGTQLN